MFQSPCLSLLASPVKLIVSEKKKIHLEVYLPFKCTQMATIVTELTGMLMLIEESFLTCCVNKH